MTKSFFLSFILSIVVLLTSYNEVLGQSDYQSSLKDSLNAVFDSSIDDLDRLNKISDFCLEDRFSDPENLIHFAEQGIQLAEKLKDSLRIGELIRIKGRSQNRAGKPNMALESLNKSLELAMAMKDSVSIVKTYSMLGFYYDGIGDVDKAKSIYNNALLMAIKVKAYNEIKTIRCYLAIMLKREGQYEKAIALYDSILIFSSMHNLDTLPIVRNKAQALINMGKYSDALDIYYQVKKSYDPQNDHLQFAQIDHNIAFILKCNKLNTEALKYYYKIYDYFSENNDLIQFTIINESIGEIKLELNELEEAEEYLLEGLVLREENGMGRTGTALKYLGVIKLKQQKFAEAEEYLMKALVGFRAVNNNQRESETLSYLSELNFEKEAISKSIFYADSSRVIATALEFDQVLSMALDNLIKAYKSMGRYEDVYVLEQERNVLKQKLEDPEKLFKISQQIVRQRIADEQKISATSQPIQSKLWPFLLFLALIGSGVFMYFKNKKINEVSDPRYLKDRSGPKKEYISNKEAKALSNRLDAIMADKKPFLNTELKLKDLALIAETTDKKLSAYLNDHLGVSFYDYINTFRIKEFKSMAVSSEPKDLSIIGMAYVCGFKSKTSFYRCFKKEMSMSPSEFLKNLPR